MARSPPRSTRTYSLFPDPPLFRYSAAPDQARAGVRVQEVRLSKASGAKNSHRFFLTLIQSVRQEKRVAGRIEMAIFGRSGANERKLALNDIAPDVAGNLLFSLKYFEEFSGQFQLPDGFKPQRVVISLIPSSDGADRKSTRMNS